MLVYSQIAQPDRPRLRRYRARRRVAKVKVLCRNPDKLKRIYSTLWDDGALPETLAYDKIVETGRLVVITGSLPIGGEKGGQYSTPNGEQISSINKLVNGSTHILSFLGMDPKNMVPICRPAIEAIMNAVASCDMIQNQRSLSCLLLSSWTVMHKGKLPGVAVVVSGV